MSEAEKNELRQRLADLSHRLDDRVREFKEKGEFSDIHHRSVIELRQRQGKLIERVHAAEHTGKSWELAKAELARDFGSLFDDFLALEETLDSGISRKKP